MGSMNCIGWNAESDRILSGSGSVKSAAFDYKVAGRKIQEPLKAYTAAVSRKLLSKC
jgi:hypothetical protein